MSEVTVANSNDKGLNGDEGKALSSKHEVDPALVPDVMEQALAEQIDNSIPTFGFATLPTVALGGSAGSIPALREFLENVPAGSGLAYVVVLHLDPAHESTLPELLQQHTPMPVRAAEDGVHLEADHVYVIPPGKHLIAVNGHLRLVPLHNERGRRTAVDLFFRSLADTHGAHAAAVVLSGLDGDGAIGLPRVKERGGLTIIQDPQSAEHQSMPVNSLDTGMVDWVLRPADMPRRIAAYFANEGKLKLPSEQGPQPAEPVEPALTGPEALLREILLHLRSRTGRDFSYYKRATILRRIARRMLVAGVTELADYLSLLRTNPGEAPALLQDLLISVTNFFRDRSAFEAVEKLIPELFSSKRAGDNVRVWSVACATGEEAYSLAMLLMEHAGTLDAPPTLQVFGCDLDERAIQVARTGFYPDTISADVSEDRLRRFFNKEPGGWRVRRELREMVLFTAHDVFKDAPFSRMDLIACRNLMIYLDRSAHVRLLDLFHFALKASGLLFLGTSESVEEGSALYGTVDKRQRIYRHRPAHRQTMPVLPNFVDGALNRVIQQHEQLKKLMPLPSRVFMDYPALEQHHPDAPAGEGVSARELHFRLLGRDGPASLVVDAEHDILHASENAHEFLRMPAGEPTRNVLRLVHPGLRVALRAALLSAQQDGTAIELPARQVSADGLRQVDLRVVPAGDLAPGAALVLFTAHALVLPSADSTESASTQQAAEVVQHIERELSRTKLLLRDAVEQHQASTEEFEASNKELQAMNEELRSTGEELETGREELQSVNEELITLNAEFKIRAEELTRINSDLRNLMSATHIATVFLDRELMVMRYTPSAVPLFNLIPGDIGRPIEHLNRQLDYPELADDARQVLASLIPAERELRDGEQWYLARVLPYRTADDRIAGVVLTFFDITDRRVAEKVMRASEERYRSLFESMDEGFCVIEMIYDEEGKPIDFRYIELNPAFEHQTGLVNAKGRTVRELIPNLEPHWCELYGQVAASGEPMRFQRDAVELNSRYEVYAYRVGEPGQHRVAVLFNDISERLVVEEALRATEDSLRVSRERLDLIVDNAREYAIVTMDLDRRITSWNIGAEIILGYPAAEAIGELADLFFTPEDRAALAPEQEAAEALAAGRAVDERWHLCRDGRRIWGVGLITLLRDAQGKAMGLVKIFRDQTIQLHTAEALEQSRRELKQALDDTEVARDEAQAAGAAKDRFLAVLSHELRTPLTPLLLTAQLLARHTGLPPKVRSGLQVIERNVLLETRLVDDLLDVTRIATGKMQLERQLSLLRQTLTGAAEVVAPELEAKQQRLALELGSDEVTLSIDDKRIQQVLWNLLRNACKFSPAGSAIVLASRVEAHQVTIEVRDSGVGFEPGAEQRIFAAFEQESAETTRRFGGLGLGLAIARAVVEAHGGRIFAASPGPNLGATFTIELPMGERPPPA